MKLPAKRRKEVNYSFVDAEYYHIKASAVNFSSLRFPPLVYVHQRPGGETRKFINYSIVKELLELNFSEVFFPFYDQKFLQARDGWDR